MEKLLRDMWKFLIGVVVGVVVAFVGLLVIAFAFGRLLESKPPMIAANSVLVLSLNGEIPEAPPVDIPIPLLETQSGPTVRDLWTSLHTAASDNRIKAVVLQPQNLTLGWGKLEEIRQEVLDFKRSGKPVYAYLQGPGSQEYYLASAADKIFLSPDDDVDVKGFRLEAMYFKNTLDKLGVQVQVDHMGRYKDAGDIFTRSNMSPETREVLGQVLDQIYGDFCATVGASRHKSADDIKTLIDNGPFTADQARSAGLVDELGYGDQVYGELKNRLGASDIHRADIRTYFRAEPGRGDRIAVLVGEGDIVRGHPQSSFGNEEVINSGSFANVVRQVREDRGVKGVILRIDSPGGDAVASDEILHELKLLSAAKPLVVSMSDVAASGGYFIAMTGDSVISYPDTITGSIGVLYIRPNFHSLYDKLGIQEDILTRGKLADMDSVYLPLSDAARQKLHESIASTYRAFVSKVANARKRSYDQIDPVAQGRVWMGVQARQNGLVDQLGGLDEAVSFIRKRANLSANGQTNLVLYPPRRSLVDVLMNPQPAALEQSLIGAKMRSLLPQVPEQLLLHGGMLRFMPYRVTVR